MMSEDEQVAYAMQMSMDPTGQFSSTLLVVLVVLWSVRSVDLGEGTKWEWGVGSFLFLALKSSYLRSGAT